MNKLPKKETRDALAEKMRVVLSCQLIDPFIKSMTYDPFITIRLSNVLVLLNISEEIIMLHDKNAPSTSDNKKVKEKILYLGYLSKIYRNALYLLGATDYIGSIILLRGVFELLVGISTERKGGMRERINSISFLKYNERGKVYKLWRELSAWSHPYGKWIKNICPLFYSVGKNYHPDLLNQCLGYSDSILDFMLTITIEHFELIPSSYAEKYIKVTNKLELSDISYLEMFRSRLKKSL